MIKLSGDSMKIMIIEDDVVLREELARFLKNNGYECEIITTFDNVVDVVLKRNASLLLLDINLPDVNGKYLCREIRKETAMPIIMVTSSTSEIDELISIQYGADDYITKPYNPQILLARIEAVLKRYHPTISTKIVYKDMQLNLSKSTLEKGDEEMELSKNEAKILYFLLKNQGVIKARDEIMDYLWGNEEFIDDNTLTVNINRLRKKLEMFGYENMIQTKRGQGYLIS